MELKDLEKQYKKIQRQLYYKKKMEALKANQEAYEEFKRKERARVKKYRDLKKMNKKETNMPKTVEELKKEIKKLKAKEACRRYYTKLKADTERYAKKLASIRERYNKKKAEKAVIKAAEEVVNQPITDVNEPHWNNYPTGIANNEADKNQVVGIENTEKATDDTEYTKEAIIDKMEIQDEDVSKAYENFINCIKAYVPNILHTFEIYKAFGNYVKAYEKFLDTKKKYLLDKITDLFNKE